jgi:sugar phosphate permease
LHGLAAHHDDTRGKPMSFDLLSLGTVAIVAGFVAVLAMLLVNPHVNALIQGDWKPDQPERS